MNRPVRGRAFFLAGAMTAFRVVKIVVFPWLGSRGDGEHGEEDRVPLPVYVHRRGAVISFSSFYAPSS